MIDKEEKLLTPKDKMMRRSIQMDNSSLAWSLQPEMREAPQFEINTNPKQRNASVYVEIRRTQEFDTSIFRRSLESSNQNPLMNRRASKIIKVEKDVKQLQEEIIFDHRLKEQYMMKENIQAVEAQKFQKKWLSKIKNVALLFYYLLIPFV